MVKYCLFGTCQQCWKVDEELKWMMPSSAFLVSATMNVKLKFVVRVSCSLLHVLIITSWKPRTLFVRRMYQAVFKDDSFRNSCKSLQCGTVCVLRLDKFQMFIKDVIIIVKHCSYHFSAIQFVVQQLHVVGQHSGGVASSVCSQQGSWFEGCLGLLCVEPACFLCAYIPPLSPLASSHSPNNLC